MPSYPFEPKSNRHLEPGQYWAVPLSDGRFGCGRVMSVPRNRDPFVDVGTRMFLAALMDWVGAEPPTATAIAGASILQQGFAHILAIRETGRLVLGMRPLELDRLEPYLWRTHHGGPGVWVYRGDRPVRPAEAGDAYLPVKSTWGYRVIQVLAERALVRGLSASADLSGDFPAR